MSSLSEPGFILMAYADSLISQGIQGRLNDLPLVSKAKAPLSSHSLLFALLP